MLNSRRLSTPYLLLIILYELIVAFRIQEGRLHPSCRRSGASKNRKKSFGCQGEQQTSYTHPARREHMLEKRLNLQTRACSEDLHIDNSHTVAAESSPGPGEVLVQPGWKAAKVRIATALARQLLSLQAMIKFYAPEPFWMAEAMHGGRFRAPVRSLPI